MTPPDGTSEALRTRLEWLRLLGVEAIRRAPAPARPTPASASAPAAARALSQTGATPALLDSQALQGGLFGETPVPEGMPGGGARRRGTGSARTGDAEPAPSPLVPFLASAAGPATDPSAALAALREEIGDCRRCRLCEGRTTIVFGVGSPGARLMFVGEGPGADEDAQGEPFVGRAGQLLTRIIEAMGMRRADVYIANIVKCRPPENRTPLPDEVATCSPFLFRQIAAIRPAVIVCLGTPAAQTLFGTRETITRIRGVFRSIGAVRVMPTFHPAYLLRNPAAKREVWEDMKQVMAALETPS